MNKSLLSGLFVVAAILFALLVMIDREGGGIDRAFGVPTASNGTTVRTNSAIEHGTVIRIVSTNLSLCVVEVQTSEGRLGVAVGTPNLQVGTPVSLGGIALQRIDGHMDYVSIAEERRP